MKTRGITLIMVAAVLAILAALGTGFYTMMVMQTRSATRYADMVRADMMARAGIADAIGRLRQQAFQKTEDPTDPWYTVNYLNGATKGISFPEDNPLSTSVPPAKMPFSNALGNSVSPNSDRYSLNVSDAASRININACDNLAVVLDNLCRVIGPPLVAANLDAIQPYRWAVEMDNGDPARPYFATANNAADVATQMDLCYRLVDENNNPTGNNTGRPIRLPDSTAMYGDGYAIAGYRGRKGPFQSVNEIKSALTYVERSSPSDGVPNDPLEKLEIEVKFAAIKDYLTIGSWIDTNTICVGKFEWVHVDTGGGKTIAMDRDKSWVADDPVGDPMNLRGSLRGCYLSIVNGHGAGQLRRIRTNGIDWVEVDQGFQITPGPASSYLIMSNEDALLVDASNMDLSSSWPDNPPPPGVLCFPKTNPDGTLVDNPKIDYSLHPLCIHRAPVNINTASDKVLSALFLGINLQHGHPQSLGTDADVILTQKKWKTTDPHGVMASDPTALCILTPAGMKRLPACSGKPVFDIPMPTPPAGSGYDFSYLNNYGTLDPAGTQNINVVQKLVYRILIARQTDQKLPYMDPVTGDPQSANAAGPTQNFYPRGPFRTWDDFYFRVVKPFDQEYFTAGEVLPGEYHHAHLGRLIMANFNSNNDILKFNPNIEWIDRFGRNFTEQEPVLIYTDTPEPHTGNVPVSDPLTVNSIPIYTKADNNLKSSQRDANGNFILGAYITRNYRYKSDELIDKTDLNRSTTEFSFDSNGIFYVESTGQVVNNNVVLAERKFGALVKIYDVWRESTQAQFVQGKISKAAGDYGSSYSGQLARDAYNVQDRLALVTLPEPLVPLKAQILDHNQQPNPNNQEVVTPGNQMLDAYGHVRANFNDTSAPTERVPDVIANHILPSRYDGQIALATNTSSYDTTDTGDADTFLASFDGDLDTATCKGNGREQAKTPRDCKVRVVDTIGLLGALNDTNEDMDPGLPLINQNDPNSFRWVYRFTGVNSALLPLKESNGDLDRPYYWNNVTARMGDLHTDGVYLTSPGVAGNDATLKYLFGNNKENFLPDSRAGNDITMWAKTVWHHDDFRHHEFLNASNDGWFNTARGCYIAKYGQYSYCIADDNPGIGHSGNRTKINDLMCFWESDIVSGSDWDYGALIHGGYAYVPRNMPQPESPSFRFQPFRWSFVGARRNFYDTHQDSEGDGPRGHWAPGTGDWQNPKNLTITKYCVRPFVTMQMDTEGETTWKPNQFWCFRTTPQVPPAMCEIGKTGTDQSSTGSVGQDVKWQWADPAGQKNNLKAFGMNNLNFGNLSPQTNSDQIFWHYRHMPDDGTYAVIDELKISSKDRVLHDTPDWKNDRVVREMTTSRYYLPPNCGTRNSPDQGGPPTFSSQTLLQSLKGFDKKSNGEQITVVRVSWNAFTPRFMSEYKSITNKFKRNEYVTVNRGAQQSVSTPYAGPFDYVAYNDDSNTTYYSVDRPEPVTYQANANGLDQANRGVEIEVLKDPDGVNESGDEVVLGKTFTDPTALNIIGTLDQPVIVTTDQLRYRVRFRYPVDVLVDSTGGTIDADGNPCVDYTSQYLLDTPVFDDISITYLTRTKMLSFVELGE